MGLTNGRMCNDLHVLVPNLACQALQNACHALQENMVGASAQLPAPGQSPYLAFN